MDSMLSQEEINALLAGIDNENTSTNSNDSSKTLTSSEMDAIGEISNINMGTAATTLSTLLNRKVTITTPTVSVATWDDISHIEDGTNIYVHIAYKEGISGKNIFILKENDVKVITDLMMGGDGNGELDSELTDLHLSAISEAMNQMMGTAATSLSTMLNRKIDICAPVSKLIDNNSGKDNEELDSFFNNPFVKVQFKVNIENHLNSEMMQLYPIEFVKDVCSLFNVHEQNDEKEQEVEQKPLQEEIKQEIQPQQSVDSQVQTQQASAMGQPMQQMAYQQPIQQMPYQQPIQQMQYQQPMQQMPYMMGQNPNVSVQPVQFAPFVPGTMNPELQNENIDLIMDVPLEVTVELGRTNKSIKEILDFKPGTIVELNRIAGEPVDILVNGKYVAKGEVVVIDESFGIRITDIVK